MDISSHLEPLKHWFDKLEKRERLIVVGGGILLAIIFFFLAIWDPIFSTLETEKQRYQSQRQLLNWMQETAGEISMLQARGATAGNRFKNQSVSSLVELSATSTGVRSFINKQESDSRGVKVELTQADFDRVIIWINDMQEKYAIHATKIQIEPQEKPGTVNARVTLERTDS